MNILNDNSQTIKHLKTLRQTAGDYYFLIHVCSGTFLWSIRYSGGQLYPTYPHMFTREVCAGL